MRSVHVPLSVRRKVTDAIQTAKPAYKDQTIRGHVQGRLRFARFDAIKQTRPDGSEFWSARDLMLATRYGWRNFEGAIERARIAAQNQGRSSDHHFAGASKVTDSGRWGSTTVEDFHLSRFGAYGRGLREGVRLHDQSWHDDRGVVA